MFVLNRLNGEGFVENLFLDVPKARGMVFNVLSPNHLEIILPNKEIFDISVLLPRDLIVIGFPFSVIGRSLVKTQYRQYTIVSQSKKDLGDSIKRRVVGYLDGEYNKFKE